MSHPLEGLASNLEFFAANLAYNLDFIPDDKLKWKPAPTASSALEIVHHLLGVYAHMGAMLSGQDPAAATFADPQTRDEAKQEFSEAASRYAALLRGLDPATLNEVLDVGFAKLPRVMVASMGVSDTLHHHGQIAYIQTLLGDTESHFNMSLLSDR